MALRNVIRKIKVNQTEFETIFDRLHVIESVSCYQAFGGKKNETKFSQRSNFSTESNSKESSSSSQSRSDSHSTSSNASPKGSTEDEVKARQWSFNTELEFVSKLRESVKRAGGRLRKAPVTEVTKGIKQGFEWLKTELTKEGDYSKKMKGSFKKTDVTSVVIGEKKKASAWEEKWRIVKEKVEGTSAFQKVQQWSKPVMNKGQELAEDMRERWETSDSPVVHKIQDWNESLFGETAQAAAMKIIRSRDPTFSLPVFVAEVQESIRPILSAYLQGDLAYLSANCRREVVERCNAEKRALEAQGLVQLSKILHVSEVEVKETKLLQGDPIIIVGFRSQQTHCLADKFGKVVEGGKDDILTVYHAWAMQLSSPDEGDESTGYYPTWKLREMQQLGMQALI